MLLWKKEVYGRNRQSIVKTKEEKFGVTNHKRKEHCWDQI